MRDRTVRTNEASRCHHRRNSCSPENDIMGAGRNEPSGQRLFRRTTAHLTDDGPKKHELTYGLIVR